MDIILIEKIVASVLVGYLLGAIPFAKIAALWRGVDIYSTGRGAAGTANVFWNVSRRNGTLVFVGDVSKGAATIGFAFLLGLSEPLVFLPAAAAILGHWNSIFAKFKGGDGMATFIGLFLVLSPAFTALALAVGVSTILVLRRWEMRSAIGMTAALAVTLALSLLLQIDRGIMLGLTGLGMLVVVHSFLGHRPWERASGEPAMELETDQD